MRLLLGTGGVRSGLTDAADGATNMAIDQALLESVCDGATPALRLYRWDPPTLSFGRNQPARELYDPSAARDRGIGFVRRPTGGQAVLHADELTYALVAPVDLLGRPRAAYRRINAAIVAGLRSIGVPAFVTGNAGKPPAQPVPSPRRPGSHPRRDSQPVSWADACFRRAAAGEVVAGGRKLVGSAQRCEGGVILQHGSILLSGSQAPAEELLLASVAAGGDGRAGEAATLRSPPDAGWTTLETELGERPEWRALIEGLVAGFDRALGTALARGRLTVEETTRASALRAHFASPDWTWRR